MKTSAVRSRKQVILALAGFAVTLSVLSCFMIWQASTAEVGARQGERKAYPRWIGPPSVHSAGPSLWGRPCIHVVTGTWTTTYVVANPNGLGPIADYHAVNFDQDVLSRSATSARVQIVSRAYVDTRAPFPVHSSALPSDIEAFLQPSACEQSDDPAIKALAQMLTDDADAQTQVQALDALLFWVAANIRYEATRDLPQDAVSVLQNRSGVCSGFSSLAVALLRAAGIPARCLMICSLFGESFARHVVIETYYPDAGWVPSEPAGLGNHINTRQVVAPCGGSGTTFSSISDQNEWETLYSLAASHPRNLAFSASVSSWDRNPLHVSPSELGLVLSPDQTNVSIALQVDNTEACYPEWRVEADVPWITLSASEGAFKDLVTVTVDTSMLGWGLNVGTITVNERKSIPVHIWWFEEIHRTHLPVVAASAIG